jgi:hypothetical protein
MAITSWKNLISLFSGVGSTKLFVVSAVAVVFVSDVALIWSGNQTISSFLYLSSREYPAIAFFAGFVCGHIFWPVRTDK